MNLNNINKQELLDWIWKNKSLGCCGSLDYIWHRYLLGNPDEILAKETKREYARLKCDSENANKQLIAIRKFSKKLLNLNINTKIDLERAYLRAQRKVNNALVARGRISRDDLDIKPSFGKLKEFSKIKVIADYTEVPISPASIPVNHTLNWDERKDLVRLFNSCLED